jgi:hypothetical protein
MIQLMEKNFNTVMVYTNSLNLFQGIRELKKEVWNRCFKGLVGVSSFFALIKLCTTKGSLAYTADVNF